MTKFGLLFLGALLGSTALVATTGCGDEGTGGTGGSGGSDTSSSSSSGSGTGGSPAFDCKAHCTTVMANCTAANAQYADMASCEAVCADLPQTGAVGATSGNNTQCRDYHAGAAKMDAALHCPHAGPSGGGACGTICEAFCAVATANCATQWPDAAACATACAAWPTLAAPMTYSTAATSGNTTECRMYHLSVAATDAAAATVHCPHTMEMSDTCK